MKFYSRKLHNVEDLENERKKLMKQKRALDREPLLSLEHLTAKSKGGDKDSKGGIAASLLGFLPVSAPVLSVITGVVRRQLNKKKDSVYKAAEYSRNIPGRANKGKNFLRTAAMDVVTSYLKWKAVELSVKGAKKLIDKRRQKNAELKRSGLPH